MHDPYLQYSQGDELDQINFDAIYENFINNLRSFGRRNNLEKTTSNVFFERLSRDTFFDLIYVDGSHKSHDILVDAKNSFSHLKNGGYLIFDDFFWNFLNFKTQS